MKVLIWIGCIILNHIIQTIKSTIIACIPITDDKTLVLAEAVSWILWAVILGFCIKLAIILCKKWDWNQVEKKAAEAGMTVSEYGKHGLSEKFLAKLEELCNTIPFEQVKSQLKSCMKKGIITKEQYIILLQEYSTTK